MADNDLSPEIQALRAAPWPDDQTTPEQVSPEVAALRAAPMESDYQAPPRGTTPDQLWAEKSKARVEGALAEDQARGLDVMRWLKNTGEAVEPAANAIGEVVRGAGITLGDTIRAVTKVPQAAAYDVLGMIKQGTALRAVEGLGDLATGNRQAAHDKIGGLFPNLGVVFTRPVGAPLPFDEEMAALAKQYPASAVVQKGLADVAGSLPMLKLFGLSARAIRNVPHAAEKIFGAAFAAQAYSEGAEKNPEDVLGNIRAGIEGGLSGAVALSLYEMGGKTVGKILAPIIKERYPQMAGALATRVAESLGGALAIDTVNAAASAPNFANMTPEEKLGFLTEKFTSVLAWTGLGALGRGPTHVQRGQREQLAKAVRVLQSAVNDKDITLALQELTEAGQAMPAQAPRPSGAPTPIDAFLASARRGKTTKVEDYVEPPGDVVVRGDEFAPNLPGRVDVTAPVTPIPEPTPAINVAAPPGVGDISVQPSTIKGGDQNGVQGQIQMQRGQKEIAPITTPAPVVGPGPSRTPAETMDILNGLNEQRANRQRQAEELARLRALSSPAPEPAPVSPPTEKPVVAGPQPAPAAAPPIIPIQPPAAPLGIPREKAVAIADDLIKAGINTHAASRIAASNSGVTIDAVRQVKRFLQNENQTGARDANTAAEARRAESLRSGQADQDLGILPATPSEGSGATMKFGKHTLQFLGGDIASPENAPGMAILTEHLGGALNHFVKVYGWKMPFKSIRFFDSAGRTAMEVRENDPFVLWVDLKELHRTRDLIKQRFVGGFKGMVAEEAIHSYMARVQQPGEALKLYNEMTPYAREKTRKSYNDQNPNALTDEGVAKEYFRMRVQLARENVFTEAHTRGVRDLGLEAMPPTARTWLQRFIASVKELVGVGKSASPVYDRLLKSAHFLGTLEADIPDHSSGLKPKGYRIRDWTAEENWAYDRALQNEKFAKAVAGFEKQVMPWIEKALHTQADLAPLIFQKVQYDMLPNFARRFNADPKSVFNDAGKFTYNDLDKRISNARKMLAFKEENAAAGGSLDQPLGKEGTTSRQETVAAKGLRPDQVAALSDKPAPKNSIEERILYLKEKEEKTGKFDLNDIKALIKEMAEAGWKKPAIEEAIGRMYNRVSAATAKELDELIRATPVGDELARRNIDPKEAAANRDQARLEGYVPNRGVITKARQAIFEQLSDGAKRFLGSVSDRVLLIKREEGNMPQRVVGKAGVYSTFSAWVKGAIAHIKDPVEQDMAITFIRQEAANHMLTFRTERGELEAAMLKEIGDTNDGLVKLSEAFNKPGYARALKRYQEGQQEAEDALTNYRARLTAARDATKDQATLDALNGELKDIESLQDVTARTIRQLSGLITPADQVDPTVSNREIANRIVTRGTVSARANMPGSPGQLYEIMDVAPKELKIVARILGSWVELKNELRLLQQVRDLTAAEFKVKYGQNLNELTAINSPRELRRAMDKYAKATIKERDALDIIMRTDADFARQYKKVRDMQQALDFLDGMIESPEYRAMETELGNLFDQRTNLVYTSDGRNKIFKNPFHRPTDPAQAKDYVESITILPREELNDIQAKENYQKLLDVQDMFVRYLSESPNTQDPLTRAEVVLQLNRLQFNDLNPDYLRESGMAFKHAPLLTDVHRWLHINLVHTAEYIGHFVPGRPGAMLSAAAMRWANTRLTLSNVLSNYGTRVSRLANRAAKEHKMTINQWMRLVNNPILGSYSERGPLGLKEGLNTLKGITISKADMEVVHAQKEFFDTMMKRGLPEKDNLFRLEPLRVYLEESKTWRKAFTYGRYMVPRRWIKEARTWAAEFADLYDKKDAAGMSTWLNNDQRFQLMVMSHLETLHERPSYKNSKVTDATRSAYRAFILKRFQDPGQYNVSTVEDLVERLGRIGVTDAQGNPLSNDAIHANLLAELRQVSRNIMEAPKILRPEQKVPGKVTMESADNFTNTPRGDLVAPEGMYDYNLVTGDQHMGLYGEIQRPYMMRYVEGVNATYDALLETQTKMLSEAQSGTFSDVLGTTPPKIAPGAATGEGKYWLDLAELKRLVKHMEYFKGQLQYFVENFEARNEALAGFSSVGRAAGSTLLSQFVSVFRNPLGAPLAASNLALLMGQSDMPWARSHAANVIMEGLSRIPGLGLVTGPVSRFAVRTIPDAVFFVRSMGQFVERMAGDTPWGKKFVAEVRSKPQVYGKWYALVADAMENAKRVFEENNQLGLLQQTNWLEMFHSNTEFFFEGGQLRSRPQSGGKIAGVSQSLLNLFSNTLGGSPVVTAGENLGNRYAIKAFSDHQMSLESNIIRAIERRRQAGAKVDLASITLTPEEITDSRWNAAEKLAHMKKIQGPGIRLDLSIRRFAQEYFAAKDAKQAVESIHLFTDGANGTPNEASHLTLRLATQTNLQTITNRPMSTRNPVTRLITMLMNYGFWQSQQYSIARSRLVDDKRFLHLDGKVVSMLLYASLASLAMRPVLNAAVQFLYNKERVTPDITKADDFWDALAITAVSSQALWPANMAIIAGLPSAALGLTRFQSPLGVNIVPLQMLQSGMDWVRAIAQTRDPIQPTIRLISQWVPNSQAVLNRLPMVEGMRQLRDANIAMAMAMATGHVEGRAVTRAGSFGTILTPTSATVDEIVNYINAPRGPNWDKVNELMSKAIAQREQAGDTTPDKSVIRMVMSHAPMQAKAGRQLSEGEVAAVTAKLSPDHLAIIGRVEDNFNQFAAAMGAQPAAALTQPKATRAAGGGGGGGGAAVPLPAGFGMGGGARMGSPYTRPAAGRSRMRRVSMGRRRSTRGFARTRKAFAMPKPRALAKKTARFRLKKPRAVRGLRVA